MKQSLRARLAVPPGPVTLAGYDSGAAPGVARNRKGKVRIEGRDATELAELQERMFAESIVGGRRSLLLVLQGMDTSGKGGVTDHVIGTMRPTGVRYAAFKRPSEEERQHDFLWRIRQHLPPPGLVGVFDRSHYEDVLIARVHELAPPEELDRRFEQINAFEAELASGGTTVLKCFLHVGFDTQRRRLLARLDEPTKRWKFNPGDVEERARWSEYVRAYELALERCNPPAAPWYVVPADSKRYRDWAVARLVLETLRDMDLEYPQPDFDLAAQRERLRPPL